MAGRGRPKGSKSKTKRYRVNTLTPEEIQKTGVAQVRKLYNELAQDYKQIMERDLVYCVYCDEFHSKQSFYEDKRFGCGVYPECKEALKKQALDYDPKTDTYKDNQAKTIEVFRKLDLPFIQSVYDKALLAIEEDTKNTKSNRGATAYASLLTTVKSLPNYRKWNFSKSQYDDSDIYINDEVRYARPEIKKLFGEGFTENDYLYLQDKYDDFYKRTQVDSISQEQYVILICFNLLNQWKAQRSGLDTKDLIKSYNDLMAAANLQPKQSVTNTSTDNLSYGQQIEKLEMTRPVSEPSEEFKDVDGIMKYISTWFLGHIAKAFGLNNVYSRMYEEEARKYTVEPPSADEEGNSKEIRQKLFGKDGE